MPVAFNEPLSFLQRLTEYMEHTALVRRAARQPRALERMQVSRPAFVGVTPGDRPGCGGAPAPPSAVGLALGRPARQLRHHRCRVPRVHGACVRGVTCAPCEFMCVRLCECAHVWD